MKSEKNILIAFILNLVFSIFEVAGGIYTGSTAIISDAVHDFGDAVGIGVSCFLEKKSKQQPDEKYTFGYLRYSVMGSVITSAILLVGSFIALHNAVHRIINPVEINYNGMLFFAVIGVSVNFCAAYFTHGGESLNQKVVNLHMLEDVLGWSIVLIGALVMKFTNFVLIDSLISIFVAVFIVVCALKNLKAVLDLFLLKTPDEIEIEKIEKHISEIEGIKRVHHIHVWSIDGNRNYATMHLVTEADCIKLKTKVREELKKIGIGHATLEIESSNEECIEKHCHIEIEKDCHHTHHHH